MHPAARVEGVLLLAWTLGACLPAGEPDAPRFVARHELALSRHKPLGVLGADLDGDGKSELVCAAQSPGALLVWDAVAHAVGSDSRLLEVAVGGHPLGPRRLSRAGGGARLVLASRETRELVIVDPAWPREAGQVERKLLDFVPTALACGSRSGGEAEVAVFGEDGYYFMGSPPNSMRGGIFPQGSDDVVTCAHVLADGSGIVVGLQESQRLVLLELSGEGGITRERPGPPLGGIPRAFAELDLDRDGDRELAVAQGDHALSVFGWESDWSARSHWDEPVQPLTWWVEAIPLDLEAGDLDHDGADELVVLCFYDSSVQVLDDFAREGPASVVEHEVGHTPWDTALADVDGDGWLDLAVSNRDGFRVGLALGGADGFEDAPMLAAGRAPRSLVAADLDGDARPELVVLGAIEHELVLFANSEGELERSGTIAAEGAADALAAADVDGDGDVDVAWLAVHPAGQVLEIASNDGAGVLAGMPSLASEPLGSAPGELLLADLDGDGRVEAVVSDPGGGRVLVLARGGASGPAWMERARATLPARPRALALVHEPGERTPAIAVGLEGPGERVGALLLDWDGGAELVERSFFPTAKGAVGLAAGDLDGDGRDDLVVLETGGTDVNPGRAHPFLNRAGEPWLTLAPLATGNAPFAAALGDLDGDARADLLVSAQHSNHLNAWLARAGGEETLRWQRMGDLGVGRGPLDIALADLDGDGRVDVLCADHYSSSVSVVRNRKSAD